MLRELLGCRDDDPGVRKVDRGGQEGFEILANRWSVWLGGCEPSSAPDLPVGPIHLAVASEPEYRARLGTKVESPPTCLKGMHVAPVCATGGYFSSRLDRERDLAGGPTND